MNVISFSATLLNYYSGFILLLPTNEFIQRQQPKGTITDPRRTNSRNDKPQTDKHQTQQTLDMIKHN